MTSRGNRMRNTLFAGVVGLVLALGVAGTTTAASAPGAAKLPIQGPQVNFLCDPPQSNFGSDFSETLGGFVIYNYSAENNTIKATVSIKGGAPNTDHLIYLVQNTPDCQVVDGVLTTNRNGNGTLTIRETAVSGSARVAISTTCPFCLPTYLATESYSWS